jgi:hypothetical protein
MPDNTLNQLLAFLKGLNTCFEKLDRMLEQLEIRANHYQRLSAIYKELAETLDHIDGVVFDIRQQFNQMAEVYREKVL